MRNLDDILVELGDFGRYQIVICIAIGYYVMVSPRTDMFNVIALGMPDYRCSLPGVENDTYSNPQNEVHRSVNFSMSFDQRCASYEHGNETKCSSWVFDERFFRPSAVMEFSLVCDRTFLRATSNTVFMLGQLVGALVCGLISDRFGRKKTVLGAVLLQLIAVLATALSPNIYVFMVARCFDAVGDIIGYTALFVLGTEMVGPSKRTLFSVGICCVGYSIGNVFMTMLAYLFRNWRHLAFMLLGLLPPMLAYWWLIPESLRWLISQGHYKEATKVLEQIAKVNKKELQIKSCADELNFNEEEKPRQTFLQFIKNKTCVIRMCILLTNWVAIVATYFALSLNSGNLAGNIYLNYLITAAIEIPACLFALFAPIKFGRKKPHAASLTLGGIACLASLFVVLFGDKTTSWAFIFLSTIGKFGAASAFASVYVLTAEIQPTSLRTRSIGICSMVGRIGSMLAPFIADLGKLIKGRFADALPLVIVGALSITAGVLSLFLPETYNKPLPDTIEEAAALGQTRRKKKYNESTDTNGYHIPLNANEDQDKERIV